MIKPAYRYGALITAIYDADTIICDIDVFNNMWKKNEIIRLYGINAQEIRRSASKGIDADDVKVGFDHRDALIKTLGLNPDGFSRKVRYHKLDKPVWVVIETIKDTSGKFGRLLGIIHKGKVNVNEHMRDIIGGVEFYDGQEYPHDYPIRPPS